MASAGKSARTEFPILERLIGAPLRIVPYRTQ